MRTSILLLIGIGMIIVGSGGYAAIIASIFLSSAFLSSKLTDIEDAILKSKE